MPVLKLTMIERKRIFALLICLLLAVAGWLFLALNNKYIYTSKTVLLYENFPQNKAFHPLQSDTVDLQVEGTGWQLLFARLRVKPPSISISLEKLNNRNYILFSEQLLNVNQQLETSQKIISVKPDTLFFDFSKRTVKRVPVQLVSDFTFQNQYGLTDEIRITPSYVTVSGPVEELQKIDHWRTDTLQLKGLRSSAVTRISMEQNTQKNVSIFPSNVEVKLHIDEFTEKEVELPLKVINNNEFYTVRLFPKKIKLTFLVSLSDYPEIDESFIEAVVDMNEWKVLNHNRLTVKLQRFPKHCKAVKIVPGKVDFIIEK